MSITVPRVVQNINGTATPVPLVQQTTSYTTNSFSADTTGTQFPLQLGVPFQSKYTFKIYPASNSATCIAQSQAVTANVPLTLRSAPLPDPNVGVNPYVSTPVTYLGQRCVMLDRENIVSVTFSGTTTAATTITVNGYDYRGVATTSAQTYNVGTPADLYLIGARSLALISSVTFSANPGVNVSIGNSNYIGLPYLFLNTQFISFLTWENTYPNIDNYTTPGCNWRIGTVPAVGNSCRGFVVCPSSPDNNTLLTMEYWVMGADSEHNNLLQNLYPTALALTGVEKNASGQYVWPYLTTYDLVGIQYPGENAFFTEYQAALTL